MFNEVKIYCNASFYQYLLEKNLDFMIYAHDWMGEFASKSGFSSPVPL